MLTVAPPSCTVLRSSALSRSWVIRYAGAGFGLVCDEEMVRLPSDRIAVTSWLCPEFQAVPQKSPLPNENLWLVLLLPPTTTPRSPLPSSMPGVNLGVVTLPIGAVAFPWMPDRICWICAQSSAVERRAALAAAPAASGTATRPAPPSPAARPRRRRG